MFYKYLQYSCKRIFVSNCYADLSCKSVATGLDTYIHMYNIRENIYIPTVILSIQHFISTVFHYFYENMHIKGSIRGESLVSTVCTCCVSDISIQRI